MEDLLITAHISRNFNTSEKTTKTAASYMETTSDVLQNIIATYEQDRNALERKMQYKTATGQFIVTSNFIKKINEVYKS